MLQGSKVVKQCVMYTNIDMLDTNRVYNYARVPCHYGCLILEFRDAFSENVSIVTLLVCHVNSLSGIQTHKIQA